MDEKKKKSDLQKTTEEVLVAGALLSDTDDADFDVFDD